MLRRYREFIAFVTFIVGVTVVAQAQFGRPPAAVLTPASGTTGAIVGGAITGPISISGVATMTGQEYAEMHDAGNSGASKEIDWDNSNNQRLALTGNVTLTMVNPRDGAKYSLLFSQDATATRTVTWPASVRWPRGVAPVITTGAEGITDLCTFIYRASDTTYFGSCAQNYAAAPVAGPFDVKPWLTEASSLWPNAVVMSNTAPSFTTTTTSVLITPPQAHAAAGATETLDLSAGSLHRVILDENVTLTLSNPVAGGRYVVVFVQDGSGGNSVTWPAGAVLWPAATAPTVTTTANAISVVALVYDGTLSKYLGMANLDIR